MERVLVYGMTYNLGGIESYLMNLLERLDPQQLQFDFVTDFAAIAYRDELEARGCRIYNIPAKSSGVLAQWRALHKTLRAHPEYHKIYFNVLDAGSAITMLIPWLMGRQIVTHSHSGDTDKQCLHRLTRPFLNLFTAKRCACSGLAADFLFGPRYRRQGKVGIIPNAIDTRKFRFDPARRTTVRLALSLEPSTRVILHVGRPSRQKNPFRLLDIFAAFRAAYPDSVLLYIGTGELETEVRAYAARTLPPAAVRFLGLRRDIPDLMFAADAFLLPSLYEGLPMVAVEAQAAGLPVLASDAVSTETALTPLVRFLSLDEPDRIWAEALAQSFLELRESPTSMLIDAGFDSASPSAAEKELVSYLLNGQA